MKVDIPPALALQLYLDLRASVVALIRANKKDEAYQPTDDEVVAQLRAHAAEGDAAGEAWKTAHPLPPAS